MNKKQYDAEYHKQNIKGVYIPFNMNNPKDAALYARLMEMKANKTGYIKALIERSLLPVIRVPGI